MKKRKITLVALEEAKALLSKCGWLKPHIFSPDFCKIGKHMAVAKIKYILRKMVTKKYGCV